MLAAASPSKSLSSRRGGPARRCGRGAVGLLALAAFAAAGGTVRAGAATPATPKAATPKAATPQAVTPKAVTPKAVTPKASPPSATAQAAAARAKRLAVRQGLLDQARQSLALVRMTLQRDLRPEAPPIGAWVEAYITEKQPFEIPGVWIDSSGLLLVSEIELNDERIKEIQILDAEGHTWPAERAGVLREVPGMLFRVVLPAPQPSVRPPEFPALRFVPQGALHPGEDLITVTLTRLSTWDLKLGSAACTEQTFRSYELPAADGYPVPTRAPALEAGSGTLASWGGNPDLTLLFNENGGAVGVALGGAQPAADPEPYLPWRGLRLLQAPRLSHVAELAQQQQLERAAAGWVVEVKLFFRQEDEDEAGGRFGGRGYAWAGGDAGGGSGGWSTGELELAFYGIAVSDKLVFLPGEVDKELLKRLERLEVGTDGALGQPPPLPPPTAESEESAEEALRNRGRFGKGFLARWRGAYRELGGFLVEMEQLPPKGLPVPAELFAAPQLKRGELMYLVHPQRKFDRKYLFVEPTRWVDERLGYRNAPALRFFPAVESGSFLVDADGRPCGFGARLRREDEEEERFRSEPGSYYGYDGGGGAQLYVCARLKERLTAPAETAFDPKLKPLPKEEQKRLPWLGVEFTGLGQPLAKKLGVLKETKDGAIGMLLIVVYRGSPAERLGLKEGDILLSLTPAGKPKIELSGGRRDFYGGGYGDYFGGGGGMFGYGFYQPWLARRNTLTSLLETLGVGKKISLEVCRRSAPEGQRVTTLAYEIEKAPPDFESSKKRRDKILGLTVKNLTYEVRYACKLEAEAEGVVVAKVDEGKSAAVARIAPLDLIRAINDEPVRSVDALMQTLGAARQAGQKTVKVRLWRLGEPERYADLFLEELKSREHEEAGGPGGPGGPGGAPAPEPEPELEPGPE